jgi:hypothetical protein
MVEKMMQNSPERQLMPPVDVLVEQTPRAVVHLAKDLYTTPLVMFREYYQNASDSGSKTLKIIVSKRLIQVDDEGSGMSKTFIEEEFNKLGERFKTDDKFKGRHGMARVSGFGPIVKEEHGGIKYSGRLEIITCDGKNETFVLWPTIMKYKVSDSGTTERHGTSIKIIGESFRGIGISEKETVAYLQKNLVETDMLITVNGKKLESIYKPVYSVTSSDEIYTSESEEEFGIRKSYTYKIGVQPSLKKLAIAEKGILVEETYSAMGGVIDFKACNNQGMPLDIETLSRESTKLSMSQVKMIFYKKGVVPHYLASNKEDRQKMLEPILDVWSYLDREDAKRLLPSIVVDGKEIGEWQAAKLVAVSREREHLEELAEKLGYHVMYADRDSLLYKALYHGGIKDIESYRAQIENAFKVRGTKTSAESKALKKISGYIEMMSGAAAKVMEWGFRENEDKEMIDTSRLPGYVTMIGPGVTEKGITLYIAEHISPKERVFNIDNEGKKLIALNVANSDVKECLDLNRTDLLVRDIAQAYQNVMGRDYTDNYETLIDLLHKVYKTIKENQMVVYVRVESQDKTPFISPILLRDGFAGQNEEVDAIIRVTPMQQEAENGQFAKKLLNLRRGSKARVD